MPRVVRVVAVAAVALSLTACAGLPSSGPVTNGNPVGETLTGPDVTQLASGPVAGASPVEIVEGFLEAGVTPNENWSVARQFLSPDAAAAWRPSASVAIDLNAASRTYASSVDIEDEDATEGDVRVQLDQIASVDETGAYTEAPGAADVSFALARDAEGEWRITETADGIVLDEVSFRQVFGRHSLQYFDQGWDSLVPDVRWFPRRVTVATAVTQAVISGEPSPWLSPAVRSAFPADVDLARDAVPIDGSTAEVALSSEALALDATTLARMRTQLERSLASAGVAQVRFTVDGRILDAGTVPTDTGPVDTGTLVLTEDQFGVVVGDEVTPLPGVSAQLLEIPQDIATIDVAGDGSSAAVQLRDREIFLVRSGRVDALDSRADLIAPTLDRYGYTWSVPEDSPQDLVAWDSDVVDVEIADAWPTASAVSHIRVAADGSRIAALVTVGSQRWAVVSAIVRDQDGVPQSLGPMQTVTRLSQSAGGLAWLGADSLGILLEGDTPVLLSQIVGGPGVGGSAPVGATSLAGARTGAGIRVLGGNGVVFAQRGSAWQESLPGVVVLATRAGY
ncbi:MAG: GerMN domain-containing protein [Actinomycetota bacterium]